jgi:hypothetical protein
MLPVTWPLLKMIWHIHYHARPRLLDLVNSQRQSKQVFHITSPSELHRFIAAYCKEEALPENHG